MHILITRKPEKSEAFSTMLQNANHEVDCIPFIITRAVPVEKPLPRCTHIFFTSPRCVDHFFGQNLSVRGMNVAALSAGTATALQEKGITPDFPGAESASESAAQFKKSLKPGDKVLIPRSDRSKRRLQRLLNPDQYEEFILYSTQTRNIELPHQYDLIVFTSPAHVEGYILGGNPFPRYNIAIGRTTAEEINKHGGKAIIAPGYTQKDLAEAVLRLE